MLDLNKIMEALKALLAEIEAAAGDAEKEPTEEGKAAKRKLYEAKCAEYDALEKQVDEAKAHAKRRNVLSLAEQLAAAAPAFGGKSLPVIPQAGPAQAKDHEKDAAELEGLVADYICGKSLSDNALSALAPKSQWKEAAGKIALPNRLANMIMPGRQFEGRALPLTSIQASPANLFQADFRAQLLTYQAQAGLLWERVMKIPCSSGTVLWPALKQAAPGAEDAADEFGETGSVACTWTAEGAEKPGTEPEFEQRNLPTFELSALTKISKTLLRRSSIDIDALMNNLFRQAIGLKIDRAIINGDGVGKPQGILQAANIAAVARAAGGTVGFDDLVKLEFAVAPQFRGGAVYAVQDKAVEALKLKKDNANRPLFIPAQESALTGVKVDRLNGYPCIPMQYMPALGAAGDIVFGQLVQYASPVEQEVLIGRSEHQEFSKGNIVMVVLAQVGGKVLQTRAFSKLAA